jgi:acetylglutamate kinase
MIHLTWSRELTRATEVDCPIARFSGNTVVVKYGGAAMERSHLRSAFSRDIGALRAAWMSPIVVQDEGRDVVQLLGASAMGLSAWPGHGRTADVATVNTDPIQALQARGIVPVVGPVGVGADDRTYHIDADLLAGEIAAALGAVLVIYLTDAAGIRDRNGCRFRRLSRWTADSLVREGMIDDGMLPKIEGAVRALKGGAAQAQIINGRIPHALALALRAPHGMMGTEIVL